VKRDAGADDVRKEDAELTSATAEERTGPQEAVERSYVIWGEQVSKGLREASENRRRDIKRLDRIDNFIFVLIAVFALTSVGLAVLGISTGIGTKLSNFDVRYLAGGFFAALLSFMLNIKKTKLHQQRLLLMESDNRHQTCLQLLDAASKVSDPELREKLISDYAAALTEVI
jgi:hypothetical protein